MNMNILQNLDRIAGIQRPMSGECIGIYISLTDVYVAQVSENSGGLEVNSLIKLPVGDIAPDLLKPSDLNEGFFSAPKHWLEPIQKILESREWKTKDVVVSLAPAFCIHRHFVMQDIQRSYWKQTIPLQARKYIHYPFEMGVYDYYVYPFFASLSKVKKLGVVFCMTSARIVEVLKAGMSKIGYNLVSVECSPFSTYRLFNQVDKDQIDAKGCVYSNFTNHEGQFLYALNNVPILVREVEVQKALGSRNRLEVTNCMDFISKQLEQNPFEDVAIVSDDCDFWGPILESDAKKHVRNSKISDIFGFRIEGFPEMSVIGACLKFINKKVPDVDFYKNNRSSEEEISATIVAWLITIVIVIGLILYFAVVQLRSMAVMSSINTPKQTTENIVDFQGLYAEQIKQKVDSLKNNAKKLKDLLAPSQFTNKLSALPSLFPEEIWMNKLELKHPFSIKKGKEVNSLTIVGVSSSLEGSQKELALCNKFRESFNTSPDFEEYCKNTGSIEYNIAGSSGGTKDFVLGTKFTLKCEKGAKK